MSQKKSLFAVLGLGLLTGLCGLRWGLPGPARLRAFPERLLPTPEVAERFAKAWEELYRGIERSHAELAKEEPVTYAQGASEISPDWDFPPGPLLNSYRSLLLQSASPDEKKSFIILSRMRPWRLEFEPLYIQYGGAFIYPLGAWLKAASLAGAFALKPDLRHYLLHPEQMGRMYLAGRIFILATHLATLWLLFLLGRRLGGAKVGLLSALLFALTPAAVINSHILKPHPYVAAWFLAAVWFLLDAWEGGRRRAYWLCGACAAMAAGSSFLYAFLAGLPLLPWLLRRKNPRPALEGLAAFAAVAVLSNPYLVFSPGSFAWELKVYVPPTFKLTLTGLRELLGPTAVGGMGLLLYAAAWAATAAALWRSEPKRRLLAAGLIASFVILWARTWVLGTDGAAVRFYYPLLALGCVLAADLLASAPAWPRRILLAALLGECALRSGVALANLSADAGPDSTRNQAADFIEAELPPGASIGLRRYPEPAHTPPFRYDRYRLVVFEKPGDLTAGKLPDYLVADAMGLADMDSFCQKNYNPMRFFLPIRAGWARLVDDAYFVNAGMYVYRRKNLK